MSRNTSVIGIYPDRTTVSDAINVLHKAGYRPTDISVLSSDNQGSKDFAHEKHTKAPQGAATGARGGRGGWRRIGLVGFHSSCGHREFRAACRGWTDVGGFGWRRRRRGAGLDRGMAGGPAAHRICRQALRGQNQARRHSPLRSLRQPGVARPGEENSKRHWRPEYLLGLGGCRRLRNNGSSRRRECRRSSRLVAKRPPNRRLNA